jgi:hypothetical protein
MIRLEIKCIKRLLKYILQYNLVFKIKFFIFLMLCLKYWEMGKRPEGAFGIEINEDSSTLAGRLDRRYCREEVSIQGILFN